MTTNEKHCLRQQRVKNLLLTGQKYTVRELNERLYCNNVAETVRQIREKGDFEILTEWRTSSEGTRYGLYYHPKPAKVSKIETQAYLHTV